jgi:hypothetical protein
LVEFPVPYWEFKDLKEAIIGDHESHYMSDEALLGIPSPRVLLKNLKNANLRSKREMEVGRFRLWPFLPLSVKAKLSPLLSTVEVLCTFIVVLTWVQVIFFGVGVASIVGGLAMFLASSILHYWYGTFSFRIA